MRCRLLARCAGVVAAAAWVTAAAAGSLATTAAAGRRLTPPPCACTGQVGPPPSPRRRAPNVAFTAVAVHQALQAGAFGGWHPFAALTAAMFDAYGLASGAHPAASGATAGDAAPQAPADAVAYAAYAVMAAANAGEPAKLHTLHDLMRHHGYAEANVAGSLGARAAGAVLAKYPLSRPPTPFTPTNPTSANANADCAALTDADAWQPLCVQRRPGQPCRPQGVGFGALFNATLFSWGGARTAGEVVRDLEPHPTYDGTLSDLPFNTGANPFADQHLAILAGSGALGDYEKAVVQVLGSSASDRVAQLAAAEAGARNLSLGASVELLYALAAAIHDASAATTTVKFLDNSARPLSVIQCAYTGRMLTAWAGPYRGVARFTNEGASPWRPYWPTPGSPGYISGLTAAAVAGLEVMALTFGDGPPQAPNCEILPAGASAVEPRIEVGARGWIANVTDVPNTGPATFGYSPASNTTVCWSSWRGLGELAGASRFYGGIHTLADNAGGAAVGRAVGRRAWAYVAAIVAQGAGGAA